MINLVLAFANLLVQTQPELVEVDSNNYSITYPIGLNPTNYTWDIQYTTNLKTMKWTNLVTLEWDSTGTFIATRSYPIEYFRLIGTPIKR